VLDQLARVMLDSTNANGVRDLASVQPYAIWLLIPALIVALVFTTLLVRQERQHLPQANHAKWVYQGTSLLLIATIAWDPLAGFIAYVAAHAIEYFVVVYKTMQSRYGKTHDRASILGKMVNTTWGRVMFLLAFLAVIYEVDQGLGTHLPNHAYLIIVYSLGILHFWYDSFIWKLRKPTVAKAFDLEQRAPA
jgi:putative flippase GtrA